MSFTVVIPARYASTRLPGKPLLGIAGRPMIEHVHARAKESGAGRVIVATDDARVEAAARGFGAEVLMTDAAHPSGTDRLAEVVTTTAMPEDHIVVNVQGDEPLLPAPVIDQVAANLAANEGFDVATLCERIESPDSIFEPAIVKVVFAADGAALYFSRAPIPWCRDAFRDGGRQPPGSVSHFRHIGLYAYRVGFLRRYVDLPMGTSEAAEALEQLRVLEYGGRIHVAEAVAPTGPGIDTPHDLAAVRRLMRHADT